jgi:hypothetical protein
LQPPDESAQVQLAAVKLSRLSSELGKLTTRCCRLVAKSRDLDILLTGLSTKPNKLPVDRRGILRHTLKVTKRPVLAPGNGARRQTEAAIVRRLSVPRGTPQTRGAISRLSRLRLRWRLAHLVLVLS